MGGEKNLRKKRPNHGIIHQNREVEQDASFVRNLVGSVKHEGWYKKHSFTHFPLRKVSNIKAKSTRLRISVGYVYQKATFQKKDTHGYEVSKGPAKSNILCLVTYFRPWSSFDWLFVAHFLHGCVIFFLVICHEHLQGTSCVMRRNQVH